MADDVVGIVDFEAYVLCSCLEEGRITNPPEPLTVDDLYRDQFGYVSSRTLDNSREGRPYWEFEERYGELDRLFRDWKYHGQCEHGNGEYLREGVASWYEGKLFMDVVTALGGEGKYPALSKFVMDYSAASRVYPAELAEPALGELDELVEAARHLVVWALVCEDSEDPIWTCAVEAERSFMSWYWPYFDAGMIGGEVYFRREGHTVRTRRFRQDPLRPINRDGEREMEITAHDTGERTWAYDSIGPSDELKVAREFWVEPREAPFMRDGRYPVAERIRRLLVASVETGNPIMWE